MPKKLNSVKKGDFFKNRKPGQNGGARKNAGRKPLAANVALEQLKQELGVHAIEKIDVKTKEGKLFKLTRIQALMNMLFVEAIEHKNVQAAKEYLDRTMGKSVQPIAGTGEGGEFICKIVGYDIGKYNLKK